VPESLRAASSLEEWARQVFVVMGAAPTIAATVAGHLVRANLSGHDSHGVLRIPQYVAEADRGELVPSAVAELLFEKGGVAMIDAGRGFGHSATAQAMGWAVERSLQQGIAACSVRRANHIGRLGEYAELAAAKGVIGIATVGVVGAGGVAPFGGRGRYLGTNPWAFGIPAAGEPMIFDAATSAVAEGKVRLARFKGVPVPEGAIVDAEGRPTTDPEDFYAGGALLPLGGSLAGHKGYGLALASALMGALAMIDDADATTAGTASTTIGENWMGGAMVIAVDPEWFGGVERYRMAVTGALEELRRQPSAAGVGEILIPGDPERKNRERRGREGIPLPQAVIEELRTIGERYGVGVPEG